MARLDDGQARQPAAPAQRAAAHEPGQRTRSARRLGWGFWLAVGWLAVVGGAATFAGLLPIPAYHDTMVAAPQAGPSPAHPLGTDGLGRDVLSRVIYGARVSLGIGLGAVAICLVLGGPLGLLAGYRRGWTERVIMATNDIALAFPALIFALAVVAFAGASFLNVLIVLGVLGVPSWTRLVRGATMTCAERDYVVAARALGARDRTVVWREVVPNVLLPVASYAFITMAIVVVAEGSLAFLGLSVQPPTPSWGGMINENRRDLEQAILPVLAPAVAMFLTVLSSNLIGDRLRERSDVRESGLARTRRRRRAEAVGASYAPDPAQPAGDAPADAAHIGAPPPLLEVDELRTHFSTERGPVRAVDGVSFRLDRGRTLAVVGESGSGKTMLIRSILGLLPTGNAVRGGKVHLDGRDLSGRDADELRDVLGTHLAAVFQDPNTALNPVRTIGTQLAEPLRVHRGMGRREAMRAGERLLASVGVPEPRHRLRQYPHQLSGGMRQRVTIAMALACDPEVLFADEPTTALDVTVQDQILRLLHRLRDERDVATVLVSHDLSVVREWADEVIVMYAGKVVERGPTEALFARARMPYTEALLRSIPDPAADSHTRLQVIEGRPPDLADPPTGCRFHPRCPYAQAHCTVEEPPLVEADDPDHVYACWFPVGTPGGASALRANTRHRRTPAGAVPEAPAEVDDGR